MLGVKWIVALLRVLLVLAFVFLLVMQVFGVPGDILHDLQESPDAAHLLWPMLVVVELELLCAQVVIVCTWKLLTMVKADRIFSTDAFAWVDGIVWAITVAWLLLAAMAATLTTIIYVTPELRDPGTPMLLLGLVLVGTVVVMLMVVMRVLLRQAAALRTDMDAVI